MFKFLEAETKPSSLLENVPNLLKILPIDNIQNQSGDITETTALGIFAIARSLDDDQRIHHCTCRTAGAFS